MFHEVIDEEFIVHQSGTSEGTQIKYLKDGFWYKKDSRGNEGLAEYLSSHLLSYTDLKPEEYVLYEQGFINDVSGCRSRDFLSPNVELITIYRLYYNEFGKNLSQVIATMEHMEERIEYVLSFVSESCGLDLFDYFRKIFTLDMLVLNEDRHLNNLGLIFRDGHFEPAPIFDQGVSLLTANRSVNWKFGMEENVRRVVARPFSGFHKKMFEYFGKGFELDVESALAWLKEEQESRERDILIFQLKKYQGIWK